MTQAPAERRRWPRNPAALWVVVTLTLLAVAGVLVTAVLALTAGAEVDVPRVESEVASGLSTQIGDPEVTVDCPDQVDWVVGGDFSCTATGSDGATASVTVSMRNKVGDFVWRLE